MILLQLCSSSSVYFPCPEMRFFLQSLLDLLQRAEDYIRDRVDLTFFSQTLPQLVEHIYSSAFTHSRHKRDLDLRQSLTQITGLGFFFHQTRGKLTKSLLYIFFSNRCLILCRAARWCCGDYRAGSLSSPSYII